MEEQLKEKILEKYRSIREFSIAINIPYNTVDSVLKRGIINSGVHTVMKIFDSLNISLESISSGKLEQKNKFETVQMDESNDLNKKFDDLWISLDSNSMRQEALTIFLETMAKKARIRAGIKN